MSVYLVIDIKVHDAPVYSEYITRARPIVESHGGRYLTRGSAEPFAGDWRPERVVIIEFPSAEDVKRCFGSPEYAAVAPLRQRSTVSRAILAAGCSTIEV